MPIPALPLPEQRPATSRPLVAPGFTIIELSIVLVIIGFIIGGVLVAQDLIAAGKIRAQITQISQIDTAANSFRAKFNGVPGDYNSPASIINGVTGNNSATVGEGNGNGYIESSGVTFYLGLAGEPVMFFAELSATGNVFNIPITTTSFSANAGTWTVNTALPPSPLGGGNYIGIQSIPPAEGVSFPPLGNYYLIGEFAGANNGAGEPGTTAAGLTVSQALALDAKLDDGFPTTGNVFVGGTLAFATATPLPTLSGGSATGPCYNNTPTPNVYYAAGLNTVACNLVIKVGF